MQTALPAIGDAAPHTAPEPTFDLTPDVTSEKTAGTAAEPAPDLLSEAPHDLDTPPQDLDEVSPVAALASSLLPPEPGAEKPASFEPTASPAPPKVERSADIIVLRRGVQRWRGITVAVSAIAALLAIYIGVEQFAPGLIPISRQSQTEVAARTPPGARLVAVLQQEPTAPAFLLTVDPQSRTLTVRTVAAGAEADRSYQLWLISSKYANPRSLGLVGTEQFTTRAIPADFDVETLRTASYAVSLEPAGGSPKDVPTGPILFTGKMVESVPGSPS
jgi:anti-sigma-K factor RskA